MIHPPRYSEINKDYVLAAYDEVVLGDKTAKEAFDAVVPNINEILQEGV